MNSFDLSDLPSSVPGVNFTTDEPMKQKCENCLYVYSYAMFLQTSLTNWWTSKYYASTYM